MLRNFLQYTWWRHPAVIWCVYILLACILTARNWFLPGGDMFGNGGNYTHYNNFIIFQQSFFHLLHHQDLYVSYPGEHFDLFKYSPTFAVFMAAFAYLPSWLGLALWNMLNVLVWVAALQKLPGKKEQFMAIGFLGLQEAITTTMNSQSNMLIAGLLVHAWVCLQSQNHRKAAFFILLTAFIKIFGILFFLVFLFYPKWWRSILPAVFIAIVLLLLPLPFTGFQGLVDQYKSYAHLLANDNSTFVKYSVMGWLESWFGWQPQKNLLLGIGLGIQLLPIVVYLFVTRKIRAMLPATALVGIYVASLLIWMVIFNHMAESATFIIAVTGVLIWYVYSPSPKALRLLLLFLVLALTCFGPSDLYPRELRHQIVEVWQLKVFPCILVWAVAMSELIRGKDYSIKSE